MRICILSVEEQWEIERIKEEAVKRGHVVHFLRPTTTVESVLEKKCDVLLLRALKGEGKKVRELVRDASSRGIRVVDERYAKEGGRTKLENYELLRKAGLPVPESILLTKENIPKILSYDSDEIVLKPISGKRGEGVRRVAKTREALERELGLEDLIAQPFLKIDKEYRILVVGDRALGAFEKVAEDWRRNIAKGARAVKVRITDEMRNLAVRASEAVGTEIAGVDIAYSEGRPFILEVNRSPLFKGFERGTGINVAAEIIRYLEEVR